MEKRRGKEQEEEREVRKRREKEGRQERKETEGEDEGEESRRRKTKERSKVGKHCERWRGREVRQKEERVERRRKGRSDWLSFKDPLLSIEGAMRPLSLLPTLLPDKSNYFL